MGTQRRLQLNVTETETEGETRKRVGKRGNTWEIKWCRSEIRRYGFKGFKWNKIRISGAREVKGGCTVFRMMNTIEKPQRWVQIDQQVCAEGKGNQSDCG